MRPLGYITSTVAYAAAAGHGALSRASDLAERGTLAAVDRVLASHLSEEIIDRVLDSTLAERALRHALAGPLMDEAVARLLESEDLWLLVDEVARSPAVTDAIGRQSLSFADQVAGAVRARSRGADDRLETAVRGIVRRRRKAGAAPAAADGTP